MQLAAKTGPLGEAVSGAGDARGCGHSAAFDGSRRITCPPFIALTALAEPSLHESGAADATQVVVRIGLHERLDVVPAPLGLGIELQILISHQS